MKHVIIIGGGPAGLTAAFELLKTGEPFAVTVLEETGQLGGISKTVAYHGNRMDMGGHRFFSKMPEVNDWWERILPLQGAPAKDDLLLKRQLSLAENGPDPEKTDRVMLLRRRVSRIYFDGKFYDYPISLKPETFRNMGLVNTLQCGCSYLKAAIRKLPEDNLENFYINSFGRRLYGMFFEYYTQDLWGRHPRDIDASWGAQRTKGLSVMGIIKDVCGKVFRVKSRRVNTSLIEEFKYPKLGPGALWEEVARQVEEMGGAIRLNAQVCALHRQGSCIDSVTYRQDGADVVIPADAVISSMPLKDLVQGMNDVPAEPARIAAGLPYRDYMTLGVLVKELLPKNMTNLTTVGNIVPDCWVYVQDCHVKMGRFQIYNNWSPYLVKDPEGTVWVGLEYFCSEGDAFWNQSEADFASLAIQEMVAIGLIDAPSQVLDCHMERIKKAYPAYFDTYAEIDTLRRYLDTVENLYCVGRNGQHRYNNLDHSMMTSFEAVRCIRSGSHDHSAIWNVNTEKEYHEEKAGNP